MLTHLVKEKKDLINNYNTLHQPPTLNPELYFFVFGKLYIFCK